MEIINNFLTYLTTSGLFLVLGGLGACLLGIVFLRSKHIFRDKELEDKLCILFFEQHLFLFTHKQHLFEYEKVRELIFFGKNKFFDEPISQISKEKYLGLGENDMNYMKELVAAH